MGEYAIRKSDGAHIKIGTCEDMYYLRYEDRDKVRPLPNNVDPVKYASELRFRLPFPDEDHVKPGDYEDFNRGVRLCCKTSTGYNVPCYHGQKLPDLGNARAFWNGKGHSFELTQVRPVDVNGVVKLIPIVHCRHCGKAWRYTWDEVLPYVLDKQLLDRLKEYV
jgi:hypothetical protein